MTDKGEELALPSAIVMRILKDALPDGINVSKEARNAVSRAAAIFLLYATSCYVILMSMVKDYPVDHNFLSFPHLYFFTSNSGSSMSSLHRFSERSASVSSANQIQISASRKTLSANDVFLALNDMLFEDMVEQLKESLEIFQTEKVKKESLSGSPTKVGAPKGRRKKSVNNSSAETSTEPSTEMLDSTEVLPTEDLDVNDTTE